jgi:DNA uptake protein ComE-like DNA-binding protein
MAPLLLLLLVGWSPGEQLDLARASRAEVMRLPVDSTTAERIWEYADTYGGVRSIYELMRVRGMTSAKLELLKPLIYVPSRGWEEGVENNIQRIQRRLAAEDGPTAAAVEEWQDRLLSPLNINRARVDDLLVFDRVSLVDAVAVVKFLQAGGRLGSRRDLGNQVPGLTAYGFRNLRNFVKYEDGAGAAFGGNYRVNFATDPDWDWPADAAMFAQALATLRDTATPWGAIYAPAETAFLRRRIEAESAYLAGMRNQSAVRQRLRIRAGDKVRAGAWVLSRLYDERSIDAWKGFASVQDLGPVRRVFVGDYRLTMGQGLMLDNNSELMARTYDRAEGLFADLSENPGFGMRGVAADLAASRFGLVGFYSNTRRDAILNPDSSVNYYIVATPRYPDYRNTLGEVDYGGSLRFDLSGLGFVPTGTRLAGNLLRVQYDRPFRPLAKYLEIPGDAEELNDPNFTRLDTGTTRFYWGGDFRTVIENTSLEGEVAVRPGRGDSLYGPAKGMLFRSRTQYDYLTLTAIYRRYDVGYDNPYNRGFCEQLRFEDTPLEKSYRVLDPAFIALQEFPTPKAEEGFFIDARYQLGRQITFTRVYLDLWRNLAWGADNLRFQGEVEYLPVWPVRLRFKQKVQAKELPKVAEATRSITLESTLRAMTSLSNYDYLTGEVRLGKVLLTPTMKYGDDASMWGDYLAVQWEHNFSDDFQGELGVATWQTNGMSQWAFEDNGIDFLEGQGLRWYAALTDRISNNLLLYLKFRHKLADYPHTGLGAVEGLHFADGGAAVRDFVHRRNSFDLTLQFDILW